MNLRNLPFLAVVLIFISASPIWAEDAAPATGAPLKQEELDQMLAPLALYPDSLLSQVLMASTYPIEIVQADRFVKAHPDLKGDALATELEKQSWDASVKSLVNFPDVLASLSDKLEWTTKIGDAFIADQKRVMDTVQKLRGKAQEQGNLQSNQQQTVTVEQASTPAQVIVIESSQPDVVYVPTYDPTVVYGPWWYPAYPPPVYYRPPGYYAGMAVSFGLGFACGSAWGYAWGDCDWHGGDIDVDIDRNTEFNRNIDRSKYKNEINQRNNNIRDGKGQWQHDTQHRKGVSYRDQGTASRFGGASTADAARAREDYRGRTDMRKQDLSPSRNQPTNRPAGGDRPNASRATQARQPGVQDRSNSGGRTNAFEGSRQSGQSARNASQRGQSSRSATSGSRSSGSRGYSGGGSRGGGGGGSRGGGGGGRGGGGRR